jgi:hypothetical protein
MTEPVRLLSSGSSDVQDLLRTAQADAPARAQLDHLAARLAPHVAAPAASVLLPWVVAGVALLGAAGVIVLARDRAPAVQPSAIHAETSPPPESTQPTVAIAAPEASAPAAPAPVVQPHAAVETPAKPTRAPIAERARPAPPPRELDLLTSAHAALHANDLARALALAERHASLYVIGTFAEEREAIAIEALHGLGQRDRARTRFTAFTMRYPHSSYRARLERMVGE